MKKIRCNLTKKHVGFSQLSQNHYISILGYFLLIFKKFNRFIEEFYVVYVTRIFEALSLLVYISDPYSKGFNSISILNFFFRYGASLKVTYNPL